MPALVHPVLTVETSAWLTGMEGVGGAAHRRDRILDGAWATFAQKTQRQKWTTGTHFTPNHRDKADCVTRPHSYSVFVK